MNRKLLPFVGALVFVAGCASSTVGPGAGAAQALVKGDVKDVDQHAQQVFNDMKISQTGSAIKNQGNQRQLTGKYGDSDITVTMNKQSDSSTNVEVDASKNLVSGNQDLARQILSKIVEKS